MKWAFLGILILILVVYGAVKPPSTENLVATAAAAEPKPPERATKVKGALKGDPHDRNEANRRLMALSEEDRRSAFHKILALAREQCAEVTRTVYQGSAKPSWNAIWNVECRGGPSYVIQVESDEEGQGN